MAEAAAQRFDEVLVRLSKYMAETGDAVMPTAELADYQKDAAAMAKAGVLVEREAGYAFFHERYRDLNIARQLTVGASPVVEWLLAVGQPLYRRGEVRRLLAYQRLEDRDVYLENLREVLGSTEIRLHIKAVLFDLLASLTDPWPEEWKVVDPFLEDGKAREHHLARQLLTTEAWATLADEIGVLDRWSTGSEHQREVFIVTLRSAPGTTWNKWAPFIREQALTNDEWRRRVLWVLTWAPVAESRALFEVVIDLLGNGLFDNSEGTKLDTRHLLVVLHELPEKQPEWAVEFIAVYVKRGQQLAREQGNPIRSGSEKRPFPTRAVKTFSSSGRRRRCRGACSTSCFLSSSISRARTRIRIVPNQYMTPYGRAGTSAAKTSRTRCWRALSWLSRHSPRRTPTRWRRSSPRC